MCYASRMPVNIAKAPDFTGMGRLKNPAERPGFLLAIAVSEHGAATWADLARAAHSGGEFGDLAVEGVRQRSARERFEHIAGSARTLGFHDAHDIQLENIEQN